MNPNTTTDRRRQREELTAELLDRVREAVREELGDAPPESLKAEELEHIEQSILTDTQLIVDAASLDELTSEGALLRHVANTRSDIQRLIRDRHPRTGIRSCAAHNSDHRSRP